MAQKRGYGILVSPEGTQETDWLKCNHCQFLVQIIPYQDPTTVGGHCRACQGFLCPACEAKRAQGQPCETWEKQFERIEARDRALQSYGL